MRAPDWLTARPIAHRGYHDAAAGRVENTLGAAAAAAERGFSIEVDLQRTADGEVVVFHDDTVDRLMHGSGRVDTMTLAELRALRFRDGVERIPTLAELFALVAGAVPLVLELKSLFDGDRRLEAAVAPILAAYRGPAVVMSFDPDSMRAMKRLLPGIPRGLVADAYRKGPDWDFLSPPRRFALRHLLAAPAVQPAFVSYAIDDLPTFETRLLEAWFGVGLITWTVRTRAQREKAKAVGAQITFEGFDPDAA
ncbi:glycerophosphodiester phosphodiesterase family protein [Prosthecomicrobium pneumaticum]|uniref:Glycerophosphoryl diester phosphodiesterase n=1 Tax=Prosthecomicrobium pneumaticum TaxID=81895 RepID=A0A7W9CTE8_9HYPH|nr:glycerophosphodiester phosphodiesterase family protein [Prosthecomicrobium pneumaticum]MBB5751067.1 glycerophosphoryl diester phosphodiesterase [Prosthecomicrobium pneumaticum]